MKFLLVWDDQGDTIRVKPKEEAQLDQAVSAWLESGGTRDSLLYLTTINGETYRCLASSIRAWLGSSTVSRRKHLEQMQQLEAEEEEMRRELGIWE